MFQEVKCGWLAQGVLEGLTRLLGELGGEGEGEGEMRKRVGEGVETWIESSGVLKLAGKEEPGLAGGSSPSSSSLSL